MIEYSSDKRLGECARQRYKGQRETVPWSEELWLQILAYVRQGASVHFAAAASGITANRLQGWLADNEVMRDEFKLAEEEGHLRLFAELRQASRGDIKGLQWLLQKRFPDVWTDKQTIQLESHTDAAALDKFEKWIADIKEEFASGIEPGSTTGSEPEA